MQFINFQGNFIQFFNNFYSMEDGDSRKPIRRPWLTWHKWVEKLKFSFIFFLRSFSISRFNVFIFLVSFIFKLLQLLRRSTESCSKWLQALWSRVVVGPSIISEHHKESIKCKKCEVELSEIHWWLKYCRNEAVVDHHLILLEIFNANTKRNFHVISLYKSLIGE